MQLLSTEMLRKMRGWYTRRKRDYVYCVIGRLDVWPQEFAEVAC